MVMSYGFIRWWRYMLYGFRRHLDSKPCEKQKEYFLFDLNYRVAAIFPEHFQSFTVT